MMKRLQTPLYIVLGIFLVSCYSEKATLVTPGRGSANTNTPSQAAVPVLKGTDTTRQEDHAPLVVRTVYVPIYSHIYFQNQSRTLNLTATLSIRNTDARHSITVTAVRYYDTHGTLVRSYVEQPKELTALATTEFIVEEHDTRGGSGANFIVEWTATARVTDPIVEAVLVNSSLGLGFAFISPGRDITRDNAASP